MLLATRLSIIIIIIVIIIIVNKKISSARHDKLPAPGIETLLSD